MARMSDAHRARNRRRRRKVYTTFRAFLDTNGDPSKSYGMAKRVQRDRVHRMHVRRQKQRARR